MTRLSAPIKASMKKTATALTLACSLLSVMSISQAQAADNIDVSFQTSVHDKFHRTLILSGFCLLK
ncbi:hypothetical protein ILS17_12950, partial [Acinetobacter baumannii]|nr:hypothetical protein [Acinetobacter baumannii]